MTKNIFILLLILGLSFFLRFYHLTTVPSEINRDEASIGYNAYSVLLTGKDEHGVGPWPLTFRAFGEYKIPGYIYLALIAIKFFGFNVFSVRLPAALFGSLTVFLLYLLVKEIFPNKNKLALIAALLLCLTPIHIQYSRQAYEATVALFFSFCGLILLLKSRQIIILRILAVPFLMYSIFIYNTYLFIVPLLICWTLLIYRKIYFNNKITSLMTVLFLTILLLGEGLYFYLSKDLNASRLNTTILSQKELIESINNSILLFNKQHIPIFIARFLHNKALYFIGEYIKNYLAIYNPKFLFFTGDNNPWHSLGQFNLGNLYVAIFPLIIIGLLISIGKLKNKSYQWLLGYFFISPVANGLTVDSPISTRLLDFHLVLLILAALAIEKLIISFHKNRAIFFFIMAIAFLVTIQVVNYLSTYFLIYPHNLENIWVPGAARAVEIIKEKQADYDLVFIQSNSSLNYIYLAFYLPIEPTDFQQKAIRFFSGFDNVLAYDKFIFDHDYYIKAIKKSQKKYLKILKVTQMNKEYRVTPMSDQNILIKDKLERVLWQIYDEYLDTRMVGD